MRMLLAAAALIASVSLASAECWIPPDLESATVPETGHPDALHVSATEFVALDLDCKVVSAASEGQSTFFNLACVNDVPETETLALTVEKTGPETAHIRWNDGTPEPYRLCRP